MDWEKRKSLIEAVKLGLFRHVGFLLEGGRGITERDYRGRNALYFAVSGGHADIVEALLNTALFDVNERLYEDQNVTLLLVACCRGHVDVVSVLLDNGAPTDDNGVVLRFGVDTSPLRQASAHGHSKVVELLCKRGANVNAVWRRNYSALHYAADAGHLDCAKVLVEHGANFMARTVSDDGYTGACYRMTPLELANQSFRYDVAWYFKYDLPVRISNAYRAVICLLAVRKFGASQSAFMTFMHRQLICQIAMWVWETRFDEEWSFFELFVCEAED
jgi:hypothetical protein